MVTEWIIKHWLEIIGALAGLVYVYFSIRRNILLWPIGFFTSGIYILVFLKSKLYATMLLQVYYVGISVYGWYYWKYGDKNNQKDEKQIVIRNIPFKMSLISVVSVLILEFPIYWVLKNFTDSPYPFLDSVTTVFSIIATWMLARKYIENWIIWIFSDSLALGLYFYMKLYATTALFLAYIILSFVGYFEWKKDLNARKMTKII